MATGKGRRGPAPRRCYDEMAQLAYLSACSAVENTSHDLLDEVIHITKPFLLVGFPHVVGTFWEAYDESDDTAKNMSRIFYKELVSKMEQLTALDRQEAFAYAAHDAGTALRMGRVEGSKQKNASNNVYRLGAFYSLRMLSSYYLHLNGFSK